MKIPEERIRQTAQKIADTMRKPVYLYYDKQGCLTITTQKKDRDMEEVKPK